jgi:hypothetical protein
VHLEVNAIKLDMMNNHHEPTNLPDTHIVEMGLNLNIISVSECNHLGFPSYKHMGPHGPTPIFFGWAV